MNDKLNDGLTDVLGTSPSYDPVVENLGEL